MSLTNGQMLQAIGPNQCQSITASALATLLSGLVTPSAHATTHKSGGSDPIKLDELAAPTDVTTLNVSTSAHGLCPKAPNSTSQVLRGDGTFGTPVPFTGDSGAGGAVGAVPAPGAGDAAASKFLKADGTWALAGAGTVTSVTGAAPIASSGGTTPAISIADATATVRGAVPTPPNDATKFLRGDATWAVPAGTGVTSVTGTAPIASSGGTTPAISIGAFGPTQLQITGSNSPIVFTSNGTWTCPAGVSAVQVECWGGGGGGGGGQNLGGGQGGGGGGGGAYSKSTAVSVSPGTVYTVNVGAAGTAGGVGTDGGAGGDSWFGSAATILAKGGGQGISGTTTGAAGSGGASGSGVGGTKFSGGNGAAHSATVGGGGGSSAGTGSIGNNASGTTGGAAPTGGAAGSNAGSPPSAASAPGGGGGGGNATFVGASGGAGQVALTLASDMLTLTTVGGGGSPTLTFPPVTGNVITDQDVQTVKSAMLAASSLAQILMRVCRGA